MYASATSLLKLALSDVPGVKRGRGRKGNDDGVRRRVGRVGALAVATRMAVSIGVAVLVVMATVVPVSPASASASDVPRA